MSPIANILLDIQAVTLSLDPPYTFTSGIKSPIYCDNRLLMSFPKERMAVAAAFAVMVREKNLKFDVVAGTATAGIPHAAWLADQLKCPMVYVRPEAKAYGKQRKIEGLLKPGQRVLLVEDLVSTGKSSGASVKAIREEGGIIDDVLCIFTYEFGKSQIVFDNVKVNLHPLCRFSTLISAAIERGYIAPEQEKKVLQWAKDPEGWEFLLES